MSEFPEIRKLKNIALIDRVFKKGEQIQSGSLAMHYLKSEENDGSIYINVAVSKKEVSLAVKRNDIKRKIRASIILNQLPIKKKLISGYYMILYKKKKNLTSSSISKNLERLKKRFNLNNKSAFKKQFLLFSIDRVFYLSCFYAFLLQKGLK